MARLVWTLPDGQQTARWAEDEGGGGGDITPPVEFVGTDPAVDQVTIKGAVDQSGDPLTYLLQILDSDGNLLVGVDYSGALDLAQGLHANTDPLTPGGLSVTGGGDVLQQTDGNPWTVQNSLAQTVFVVRTVPSGGASVLEINPRTDRIGVAINSFGGDADAITYLGPPDFNGEFRVTAKGGVIFPSADPGVVGAWWDNAGTLTRSAG